MVVPYDSGHRGARMGAGPTHLVNAGLPARLERAGHLVSCTTLTLPPGAWPAEIRAAFDLAGVLAPHVRAARQAGRLPLVLAGNCGVALGVVAGLGPSAAVAWLDAHGDFNTPETTVGGFLDGMALATVTGRCWRELARRVPDFAPVPDERVWLLGARDLDPLEAEALRGSRIRHALPDAVPWAVAELIDECRDGDAQIALHLDLDVLDPADGRVNQFAAPGGLRLDTLVATLHDLARRAPVAALTLSAYDPGYDPDGRAQRAAFAAIEAVLAGVAERRGTRPPS